ncbi:MAG: DUF2141 domain-containing protein [Flavobacteriaceae bacterium]|nr:DUF2141 domain-containing protein [Flavobacteriaceae bacterium]
MKHLLALLFLLPLTAFAQHTITVNVLEVPASEGKISVAVYKNAKEFLKFDKVFVSGSSEARKGATEVMVEVPQGEYAVAVFYDANGNDELDTNWLGIPKEKVAFSKAKMRAFGPPKFKDCCFKVYSDTEISISL